MQLMIEIQAWIARDEDGELYLYTEKPRKDGDLWNVDIINSSCLMELRSECFPEVKWSDEEPTKVKLTIAK